MEDIKDEILKENALTYPQKNQDVYSRFQGEIFGSLFPICRLHVFPSVLCDISGFSLHSFVTLLPNNFGSSP